MSVSAPIDAVKTPAWAALKEHYDKLQSEGIDLKAWFAADPDRVSKLSFDAAGLHFDLSKNLITDETVKLLADLGRAVKLEERRDALLFDVFSRLQAAARMWTARRQMKKVLNRAMAVRTIQRNARIYGELREWPWWQLYTKVSILP